MIFSPYLLLRQPVYTLTHLDAFAVNLEEELTIDHIEELRSKFLSLIQSEQLLLSLPFSSKVLYQAIPHYEFHAAVKIRKKEKQNERAFTKYLMRMGLNASPLAAFAKTQFCDWEGNVLANGCNFALNLALAQRKEFFDLCYCDTGLQHLMRHRLNPSLRRVEGGYTYIMKNEKEEDLVQIEADAQFDKLYTDLKNKDFTFAEFVETCEYDVNEFLEAQLMVSSYPIYTDHNLIDEIINSINSRYKLNFSTDDIIGRKFQALKDKDVIKIQDNWIQQLNKFAKKLHVTLDEEPYSERVFYLSSALNNSNKPTFNHDAIAVEVSKLVEHILSCQTSDEGSIDLDNLNIKQAEQSVHYDLSKIEVEKIKDDIYKLKLNEVAQGSSIVDLGVMLYHAGDNLPHLINLTTAKGKFFAPSLDLANAKVYDEIAQWVKSGREELVVLKDDSLHSKNKSHPFLREQDNFGLDFHSRIQDRLKLEVQDGKIVNSSDKKEVKLINLGIEAVGERSSLFQNLNRFNHKIPNVPEFVKALQKNYAININEGVVILPRILCEYFIIGRKKWIFNSKETIGVYDPALEVSLPNINKWRINYGLPRLVKVTIDSGRSNFLDFYNPWSVDNFLRSLKKMERICTIEEMGVSDKIKGIQIVESYFEIKSKT